MNGIKVLIIIPARNEAMSVGRVVAAVRSAGWPDVLVVNDCSTDATSRIAADHGARVIDLPINLGAWGAIRTGVLYAVSTGYDAAVTLDADGQHRPEFIASLVEQLHRFPVVTGIAPQRAGMAKTLVWKLFNRLSGLGLEDLTSGFRAYSRQALEVLAGYDSLLLEYQDVGVLLLCRSRGLSSGEVMVEMDSRLNGKSRIFSGILAISRYFLSTVYLIGAKRW